MSAKRPLLPAGRLHAMLRDAGYHVCAWRETATGEPPKQGAHRWRALLVPIKKEKGWLPEPTYSLDEVRECVRAGIRIFRDPDGWLRVCAKSACGSDDGHIYESPDRKGVAP